MISFNQKNFFPRFFHEKNNNLEEKKNINIIFQDNENFWILGELENNERKKFEYYISSQSFLKKKSLLKFAYEKKNNFFEIFPISEKKLKLKTKIQKLDLKIKENFLDNFIFFLINKKTEKITIIFSSKKQKDNLSNFLNEIFSELLENFQFIDFKLKFDYLQKLEKEYFFYSCIKFDFEEFKYNIINSITFKKKENFQFDFENEEKKEKKKNESKFLENEFDNINFQNLRYITYQKSFINKFKSPKFIVKRNKILNLKKTEDNLFSDVKFKNPEFFTEKFLKHFNKKLMMNK